METLFKKILYILIATTALCSACSTLSIEMNTIDNDGKHTICTSNIALFGNFDIAMGMQTSKKDTLMGLVVTCNKQSNHGVFMKGERLMIRFDDGTEIKLSNIYDREYDKEVKEEKIYENYVDTRLVYAYSPWTDQVYVEPVTYRALIPHTYVNTQTKSYALYLVTRNQMHDILTKKAVKVRIEIEDEDCDMGNPANFSPRINKLYNFLMDTKLKQRTAF